MKREAIAPLIGIVDDYESRCGIGDLLRAAGYRTATFESAETFLEDDHQNEVCCLVLDIDLPGLNGLELQRQLARMNISIPILFVTAQADELRARAIEGGAGAVLGKPFSEEALLHAIRSALDFPGDSPRTKWM